MTRTRIYIIAIAAILVLPLRMLAQTQPSPAIQWQASLGGSGLDDANCIQQTSDGGFIVAGHSNSTDGEVTGNHGNFDYWIVKLTSVGAIEWQKSLGGSGDD